MKLALIYLFITISITINIASGAISNQLINAMKEEA